MTVGDELLLGLTIDSNGAFLGTRLAELGIRVVRRTTVGDRPQAIAGAVSDALARTGVVITSGGLGPTSDDVTKSAVADLYGVALEFDPAIWDDIVARFQRMGRDPSPRNRSQAERPAGAVVLANRWGTAPALWLEGALGLTIMLPGVPAELRALVEHEVMPRLAGRAGSRVVRSLTVRTTGIPESTLAERLAGHEPLLPPLSLAYLPSSRGVDLRLTAHSLPSAEADRRLEEAAHRLETSLGDAAYGRGDVDLAAVVMDRLRAAGLRLATAESCTGGLLGARVTAVPGASEIFAGGAVCYGDAIKQSLLGVSRQHLQDHGAVSVEVAAAMAEGARQRFGVDAAIAITGIAGPGGGSSEKPVGTVCLAWALAGRDTLTARRVFPGSREEIRDRAAQAALYGLLGRL